MIDVWKRLPRSQSRATGKLYDDVTAWEWFPHYWPFVAGIHQSTVVPPTKRPIMRSFDVFFVICMNKPLNKQSMYRWLDTPLCLCVTVNLVSVICQQELRNDTVKTSSNHLMCYIFLQSFQKVFSKRYWNRSKSNPCFACDGFDVWSTNTNQSTIFRWFNQIGFHLHYSDVIMGAMASQITSLTIVYSTVYSGADT